MTNLQIRMTNRDDWNQIKWIYEAGIATGNATFETVAPPTYEKWISHAVFECSLAVFDGDSMVGWGKLSLLLIGVFMRVLQK